MGAASQAETFLDFPFRRNDKIQDSESPRKAVAASGSADP
jgi:hypothetical protein